jgi:hypothetical protein
VAVLSSPADGSSREPQGSEQWGEKRGLWAIKGMTEHIRIHPFPQDPLLEELANQLLECGGVLSQIISGMVRWEAEFGSPPEAAPIPDVARSLVADVLRDVRRKHSKRDLKVAASIVQESTQAICDGMFAVDPSILDGTAEDGDTDRIGE